MSRRAGFSIAVVVLTAIALFLRLSSLGNRPFHGDEAVHAFKFRELWEHGTYHYDPNEYHGPTIYYAALPVVALSGHHRFGDTTEADYRLAVALFGAAMVPLLLLLRRTLGSGAILWAGLFTALSPAFVFYSRYFIQEMLLAFFALGFLAGVWRYREAGRIGWAALAGVFAGLMIASKETAVLSFVAAGLAWLVTCLGWRGLDSEEPAPVPMPSPDSLPAPPRISSRSWYPLLMGSGVALATAFLFLSGFFSDLRGPLGYLKSYTPWLHRAGGTPLHNQPWSYYLGLLTWHHKPGGPIWTEGMILILALLGVVTALLRRSGTADDPGSRFVRFLALYTLSLFVIYSAIPYKTPWCLLSFWSGAIVLAGVGAMALTTTLRALPLRALVGCTLLVASAQLGWQAYRTSFVFQTDQRNPYVYAQPVADGTEIKNRAEELARAHPQKYAMVIKVISVDAYYWPLPWYLRRFDNVGYWTQIPADPDAPLVFASPEFDEELSKRLDPTHLMTGFYGLRPNVLFETFVRMEVWEQFLKNKKRREGVKG